MSPAATHLLCPYCHVQAIGHARQEEFYRCHSCNYFICVDWLIDDPEDYVLNDERPWLCPWCAYPVALGHELPGDEDFLCPGCSGTLNAAHLVTQHDIGGERRRRMRGRSYLLFILLALVFLVFVFSWVMQP